MRYCMRCESGVDDAEKYKHIQGGEYVLVGVCPVCGSELVTEAEPCPICGEPMPKDRACCFMCAGKIVSGLDRLADGMRTKTQSRLEIWETILDMADRVTEIYELEEKREARERKKKEEQDDNRL